MTEADGPEQRRRRKSKHRTIASQAAVVDSVSETAPRFVKEGGRIPVALVIAATTCAFVEVLDITIVNVAIPHMLGSFGATPDQITWVLTSYLVSAAVIFPLTGYLSDWLGRRRLLFLSITGFVIASALCGLAWDLNSMVVFRIAQGVFGAPLVPLGQSILLDSFPREKAGQALAIFGLGIIVAPVLGPILGGWLVDSYSWRWVFYINIPIGMFALVLALDQLPKREVHDIKTDWSGLMLLVLAVGGLQLFLDQGPTLDWFDSRAIQIFAFVAFFAGAAFLMRGWNKRNNIVDLGLLRDRNFLAGTLAITAYGISLFGSIALIPLLTQRLLGYPAFEAGLLFIPRAIASAVAMALTGAILIKIIDARWLVAAGVILSAVGTILMSRFYLGIDAWGIAWPGIIAGFGMGLFFVPLTAAAFARIPASKLDEAAGLYALMRGIGSSMGIAVVSWLFVHQAQVHWQEVGTNVTPFNPDLFSYFAQLGLSPGEAEGKVAIAQEIGRQAQMMAFNDLFWFIGWITFLILPLVLLMRKPPKGAKILPH